MAEFINEPVAVEVRLLPEGAAKPLAFVWRSHLYQVLAWGRASEEMRGGHQVRCYLVQTTGPLTWELCYEIETAHWTLIRRWAAGAQIL